MVLDLDPRHDGHRSLGRLLQVHGPLPDARTVATGGGGWHIYFAHPGGVVRNDAGRRLGPGLDVRGDAATWSPRRRDTSAAPATRSSPTGR